MSSEETRKTMSMLPGDEIRQIMWRYAERYDIQMAVMGARSVARGLVARLVADGERNTHEWNDAKNAMYKAFDESGITAAGLDVSCGGIIEGPRNLALAAIAYELSWVDGGASTTSLVNNLALGPIVEKGTPEQKELYMKRCAPAQPGENRKVWRGAFALTEALPYVGVDTGILSGRVSVAEWNEGEEPMLQVEKRGRFITNMEIADFVTVAVDTSDDRIKSSCMIIVESEDEGTFDRGSPTLKMVHQLSNTCDPIMNLKVPASRIIGGYTIQDGRIVPNLNHSEIIEAVFSRTRVTVGVMTSAKLISAVEPVIRYHRTRFRGAAGIEEGSPRYDFGLQMKEDALHRLADIWAAGEAGASLGFETTRLYDEITPVEERVYAKLAEEGITGGRKMMKALREPREKAVECIEMMMQPGDKQDQAAIDELYNDDMVRFVWLDAMTNVLCPAGKLWNTGHGVNMMREAVSLMGGYGITEDCPGFLFQKWTDGQLEATYEGPEVVQRRHISVTMNNPVFIKQIDFWVQALKKLGSEQPGTGAHALAVGFEMWKWMRGWLASAKDSNGGRLYKNQRQGVLFPMADAIAWLVAARSLISDVRELAEKGSDHPVLSADIEGCINTFNDLCCIQASHAAGEVGRICTELFYGYVNEAAETGEAQAEFQTMRNSLDAAVAGSKLAHDRAAKALTSIMIPEAMDYPL
ncbi:MAG: acyl-CoA dehydrogenase family protein [Kiritimatiellia bacterium]